MLYFCNSYKWYPYCVIGAVYLAEGGLGTCPVLSVRDSIRLHHLVAMIGPIFDGQYCHVVLGLLYMNCDIAYIYDNLKGGGHSKSLIYCNFYRFATHQVPDKSLRSILRDTYM